MKVAWNRGNHPYLGRQNGRGGRQRSKVFQGVKINFKMLRWALRQLEYENRLRSLHEEKQR